MDITTPFSHASEIDSFLGPNNDNSLFPSTAASPNQSLSQASNELPGPSYPYDMYSQQTLPYDLGFGDPMFADGFPLMDDELNSTPAFFFPETSRASDSSVQSISPMMMPTTVDDVQVPKPEPQNKRMYYSGIHQEMYQQKLQQKAVAAGSSDPKDVQINQILNSTKVGNGVASNVSKDPHDLYRHIARLKKEAEEMDEDERLLVSEEGKKLSSKERRQLRNKVSARAFRSRRKEYISQLEGQVNKTNAENLALQTENERLKGENRRLEDLTKMLLRSSAFSTFLEEISMKGATSVAEVSQPQAQPQMSAPAEPKFNPMRDPNPAAPSSEEWPLAYNNVNHVYRVELPEIALPDFDGKALLDEDIAIADGFYPMVRNEKGDIDFSRLDKEDEEGSYVPPEDLMDVLEEKSERQNLDELFPGVGVNQLLDRLDKIAGGEANPEDFFDRVSESSDEETISKQTENHPPNVRASNKIIQQAEGVYRRIGLVVQ